MAGQLIEYYRTLREDRDFEPMDYSLVDLPESYVQQTFACAESGRAFAEGVEDNDRSLVTIGVTPTGAPHVGTLGQLLTAIRFQRAGFDVQVVIADLAAYNAAGHNLETVRKRAQQYESFARALGFDPNEGILRTQEGDLEALHSAQLLARYYGEYDEVDDTKADDNDVNDFEPTAFEEDLESVYKDVDTPGEATTSFAYQLVGLLLVTDSLHPVIAEGYENVALIVGADNAGLAGHFVEVLKRSPWEANVAGLYTKLVGGLNGYPKLSKSLPDSRFTLADDPETIRRSIFDPQIDADDSEASIPFQMMRLASEYEPEELDRLADVCTDDGEMWTEAKHDYAEYLVGVAELWDA